jgi:NDP-sugar pyrophosphorylase family protein
MKVALFCGGQGVRMCTAGNGKGGADPPKPMVMLGTPPILWHLMKYYAHLGHRDFILCLGYKGTTIKGFFGFFVFRRQIVYYIRAGEELVLEPFRRLIAARRLAAYPYRGFRRYCDTLKDLQTLEGRLARGPAPWEVWRRSAQPMTAPEATMLEFLRAAVG